ncbi:hypothetical protein SBA4_170006 [Candidatus Sulfopaludibacter sp. SbA4]|nr:hypothetical protein SBA4_170006 [Candidatus Sulfopaludibacter sp. SbA4]
MSPHCRLSPVSMSLGGKLLASGAESGKTNRMAGVFCQSGVPDLWKRCGRSGISAEIDFVSAETKVLRTAAGLALEAMFYPEAKPLIMERKFSVARRAFAGLS